MLNSVRDNGSFFFFNKFYHFSIQYITQLLLEHLFSFEQCSSINRLNTNEISIIRLDCSSLFSIVQSKCKCLSLIEHEERVRDESKERCFTILSLSFFSLPFERDMHHKYAFEDCSIVNVILSAWQRVAKDESPANLLVAPFNDAFTIVRYSNDRSIKRLPLTNWGH